ncbi:TIGR02391 family protein [Nocardiopsis sp. YSL2]|uniref:TIGR02391 family protein n=1 Tax=Nocardiopsis sp. YSL2 TaxID=2939492 RepID=UPI0026F45692|nr:TIGR02391 family protein [Nocardiopsis sp. YSL2]
MEAHKNPDYLRSLSRALEDFRDALVEFLELHMTHDGPGAVGRGLAPAVFALDNADPEEIERRSAKVSRAAGRAAAVTPLTGIQVNVQGVGVIDPIVNWQSMTRPKPLVEPKELLHTCDYALGHLEGLILQAEAEMPPTVGAEAMHPTVWGASKRLWRDRHYRQAVTAAAEAVVQMVKNRTGRNDVAETSLWQETFADRAPQPGKPRLRWPGDPADNHVKNMNAGLRNFAPGVQMTIRNSSTHQLQELDEQAALERLSTLSLLARWVDECDLLEASAQSTD